MPAEILMLVGFALAAYSVVSNDSIQTLGTFLASNAHRPWWLLWLFSSGILVAVLIYGWVAYDGDPAYGRLAAFPEPEEGVNWLHVLAPFTLLVLTRFGAPVSTTFLVLSVFAPGNIQAMLVKSLSGYFVAFILAIGVYFAVRRLNDHLRRQAGSAEARALRWVVLQWCTTAFLWSQWLIQDLANIFVFLPRSIGFWALLGAVATLVTMQAVIYYQRGGAIQKVVTSKTLTEDTRSATIIDFVYGLILLVFKEWSNMPMSTTWVFLGLLAGREIAMTMQMNGSHLATVRIIGRDAAKALAGLLVSVLLALSGILWTRCRLDQSCYADAWQGLFALL